jgi:hypothetical protein
MYLGAGIGRKSNQDLYNEEAGHYAINFFKFFKNIT